MNDLTFLRSKLKAQSTPPFPVVSRSRTSKREKAKNTLSNIANNIRRQVFANVFPTEQNESDIPLNLSALSDRWYETNLLKIYNHFATRPHSKIPLRDLEPLLKQEKYKERLSSKNSVNTAAALESLIAELERETSASDLN